jgi:hypothetical protein
MKSLAEVAPAFVEMAHRIVWASVATVDRDARPRSRILHPIWEWDGEQLVGWVATSPTPTKRSHLEAHPYVSVNYWTPEQDTCVAECRAAWAFDDETRTWLWNRFKETPPPLGYDPAMIPVWTAPTADNFAALRLEPWRLKTFPGSVLFGKGGEVLVWQEEGSGEEA